MRMIPGISAQDCNSCGATGQNLLFIWSNGSVEHLCPKCMTRTILYSQSEEQLVLLLRPSLQAWCNQWAGQLDDAARSENIEWVFNRLQKEVKELFTQAQKQQAPLQDAQTPTPEGLICLGVCSPAEIACLSERLPIMTTHHHKDRQVWVHHQHESRAREILQDAPPF